MDMNNPQNHPQESADDERLVNRILKVIDIFLYIITQLWPW